MTNDQARKLLGGYATNSLTEAERKTLFEAALDDQELFDALQHEEALRELLADPVSRNQIQQALAEPSIPRPAAAAWWTRGWIWGGLASAVAAAVLIVAVIPSNQKPKIEMARVTTPQLVSPAAPVSPEPVRSPVAPPAEPKLRSRMVPPSRRDAVQADRELRQAPVAGLPAPPPPPPQKALDAAPQLQAFRQEQSAAQAGATSGFVGGRAGVVANLQALPLRYSLVKRDSNGAYSAPPANVALEPGDAVRLTVVPAVGGYLSLYQLDPDGKWERLFPASDPGLLVTPNATQTIPDSAIILTEREQKFRLTLTPVDQAPLTLDITIGPGKIP